MRLGIACAVAALLLAGCAKRDMDECRKGDRSRCPGEVSLDRRIAAVVRSLAEGPPSGRGC